MVFAAVALCVWGPSYGSATDGWPRADQSVVPYAPLPPAGEKIPTTRVAASPAPAPAGTPACRAGQLHPRIAGQDGASGTEYFFYRFRLISGHACELRGRPRVTAVTRPTTGPVRFVVGSSKVGGPWRGGVLVDRNHVAALTVWFSDWFWCAPPLTVKALELDLPHGGGTLRAPGVGTLDGCDDPSENPSARATVDVGRFTPAHLKEAHEVSAWAAVRVNEALGKLTAEAGAKVDLMVTLHARKDTPLAPCPDYTLSMDSASGEVDETHQLNCAGVTTVGPDGVPYLPAGVPVTFDIQFTAPGASVPKLIWMIRQPDLILGTAGSLTVTTPSTSPSA